MKITFGKVIVFLAVSAAVLFCTAHPGSFICTRDGMAFGEFWRLFTGHFVHFTRSHLVTNLAAFGILLILMQRVTVWKTVWLGLVTPLLLGATLYFTRPELAAYGGLSGWVSALFITVAADRALDRTWFGHLFRVSIVLFIAKLVIEFSLGRSLTTHLGHGVLVEPAAHAIGAGVAILGLFLNPARWTTGSLGHNYETRPIEANS
jgi:rhomboid family GlyGly-CTERM serine protease